MRKITFLMAVLVTLSACHTTRMGQSIGYPSPEEQLR
jgi:hypothetical protein